MYNSLMHMAMGVFITCVAYFEEQFRSTFENGLEQPSSLSEFVW